MANQDFLNAEEACRILNINRQALYRCVAKGLLRSYRRPFERHAYYNRDELESLLGSFQPKPKRQVRNHLRSEGSPIMEGSLVLADRGASENKAEKIV